MRTGAALIAAFAAQVALGAPCDPSPELVAAGLPAFDHEWVGEDMEAAARAFEYVYRDRAADDPSLAAIESCAFARVFDRQGFERHHGTSLLFEQRVDAIQFLAAGSRIWAVYAPVAMGMSNPADAADQAYNSISFMFGAARVALKVIDDGLRSEVPPDIRRQLQARRREIVDLVNAMTTAAARGAGWSANLTHRRWYMRILAVDATALAAHMKPAAVADVLAALRESRREPRLEDLETFRADIERSFAKVRIDDTTRVAAIARAEGYARSEGGDIGPAALPGACVDDPRLAKYGMPTVDKPWAAAEYRAVADALIAAASKDINLLPRRLGSTACVFDRLTDPGVFNLAARGPEGLGSRAVILALGKDIGRIHGVYLLVARQRSGYEGELVEFIGVELRYGGLVMEWIGDMVRDPVASKEFAQYRVDVEALRAQIAASVMRAFAIADGGAVEVASDQQYRYRALQVLVTELPVVAPHLELADRIAARQAVAKLQGYGRRPWDAKDLAYLSAALAGDDPPPFSFVPSELIKQ